MRSFLRKQIFDGRIKAIVYLHLILLAIGVYYRISVTDPNPGIFYMILGVVLLLFSIEEYISKKRNYKLWFILSVICGGIALDTLFFN